MVESNNAFYFFSYLYLVKFSNIVIKNSVPIFLFVSLQMSGKTSHNIEGDIQQLQQLQNQQQQKQRDRNNDPCFFSDDNPVFKR